MKTRKEKRAFLRALTKAVLKEVIAKAPSMPPEWDGWELRAYLARAFNAQDMLSERTEHYFSQSYRKRLRAFKRECATRGL
jgi:hypothetical protein